MLFINCKNTKFFYWAEQLCFFYCIHTNKKQYIYMIINHIGEGKTCSVGAFY